jgi:protein-L-isoaspartate(D-aspartate) O-methyltransferase
MNGHRILTGMKTARLNISEATPQNGAHVRLRLATAVFFCRTSGAAALAALVAIVAACDGARAERQSSTPNWDAARMQMVDEQIAARDIKSPRVLAAMRRVPRHEFVPATLRGSAYADSPLPIGHDQTISQPYIVAYMTEALELEATHKVLEIGTGSGYQAAVLGELVKDVYTIEIVAPLADRARQTLAKLGYKNVHVRTGNGYLGWPEQAPFDRVMVTAAPDAVPAPLIEQLKVGGLMAIPVGVGVQELRILRRTASGLETLRTLPVRFVPMTGKPKP